ncbi:hypothetical protein BH24ACI3_BH24ACI3_14380 [soil metagenome]
MRQLGNLAFSFKTTTFCVDKMLTTQYSLLPLQDTDLEFALKAPPAIHKFRPFRVTAGLFPEKPVGGTFALKFPGRGQAEASIF